MEWNEGTPPKTEFVNDLFFVRIEEPILGRMKIKFTTNIWYGDRWCPLRYTSYGTKITHWSYIEDPKPLGNNVYEDSLGRLECVVQGELFPDLSTPPAIKNKKD